MRQNKRILLFLSLFFLNSVCSILTYSGYPAATTEPLPKIKNKAAVHLTIGTKGDQLEFDKKILSAKRGQAIQLTFRNSASASSNLQHNLVVTQPGKEMEIANGGIKAGPEKGYLPESPAIISHTQLLNPGQSETITFEAPKQPGNYPYICTFPGHANTMKGILKIN